MLKRCFLLLSVILCLGCGCKPPQKNGIIALTPSLADAVWALNVDEMYPMIGVSPFATDKRAQKLPKVSNVGSVETIVSMHPALVLMHPSDDALAQKLSQMHIDVMMHGMDTFEDIKLTLQELGKRLEKPENAVDAIDEMQQLLDLNAKKYANPNPPEILLIIDRLDMRFQQLYLANAETYLAELVRGCGMNPLSYGPGLWVRIEAEKLIELNPKNILFFARSVEDAVAVKSIFSNNYPTLNAVQNHHLIVYEAPDITVPGPGVVKQQARLCEQLKSLKTE